MNKKIQRIAEALARQGLVVTHSPIDHTWSVRLASSPDDVPAEVLLPDDFPVEAKALRQLAQLASIAHPSGARIERALATPDFHPGDAGVAIGSIASSSNLVIPAAVGSDINCGMRLHVVDLSVERFLAKRDAFVERMKGDYFFGTRDLPFAASTFRALFRDGLLGWIDDVRRPGRAHGMLARVDLDQIERELDRVFGAGSFCGDPRWAPEDLAPASDDNDVLRDGGIATIGGGNHFVEVQAVDEIVDAARAYAWGVRRGQLAFMIHSGSRGVGKHVGGAWRDKAKTAWPAGAAFPEGDLFGLADRALIDAYLQAEATAANYGFVNRLLLAELLRQQLRALHGDVAAPLVYDVPHNITLVEDAQFVVRKGACPAHDEQPVIIPGSMGAPSFLLVGRGSARHLCSASHGAGRARSRFTMEHEHARGDDEDALGLRGVDCITLREERRVQEAPAAYKPIEPVIACQVEAGIVSVVAKLRPILTFKA